ncbi:MAG: hypothetical protein Q9174_002655 [Haloplaca sp. 1 TL-2023]
MQANARRKAKKAQLRASQDSAGAAPAVIPGTSIPQTVPGTSTRVEQLRQARRWLGNEKLIQPRRFQHAAIAEVFRLFDNDPRDRAARPYASMSAEAQHIVAVWEKERAQAANPKIDWWDGPSRKGVTNEEQRAYKMAKQMEQAMEMDKDDVMGLTIGGLNIDDDDEDEDELAEGIAAIDFNAPEFKGWTFDDVGFEDDDGSVAEEEGEKGSDEMDISEG